MPADPRDLGKRCEALVSEHGALEHCTAIEPRRHEGHSADLRLIFDDRRWLQSPAGNDLLAALEADEAVESAARRKSTLHVRFEAEVVAALERRLAAGEPAGMTAGDAFAGQRATISYVGPNTNKALHVGHLRNLVLGEALASAYEAGGIAVRRHNLVGDIGRRVCEAMGGYIVSHRDESPEDQGVPGDQFVELCCRDYNLRRQASGSGEVAADPNAEEREQIGDLADELMEEWLAGHDSRRDLWARLRGWVLDGHQRTLARMGTTVDHSDFESENIERAVALLEDGLERGIVEREDSGAVVYRTERSEYATMVLIREDGFPTEHARLLGTYDRILDELAPGEPYIEVAGYEWQPPVTVLTEVHELLRPGPHHQTHQRFYHASVTWASGSKIGSSTGEVVWIEDFLEEIASSAPVADLEEMAAGTVPREDLVDILVRAAFLNAPVTKSLPFSAEALMEDRSGPGWTVAEAWCRAQLADDDLGDAPVARTGVMQAQQHWRCLRRTIERRDVLGLSHYLVRVAESFLDAPRLSPAAAPVLARVLASLGFIAGKPSPGLGSHPAAPLLAAPVRAQT